MTTHAKEHFWIGVKGGLVEWKHYKRMGNAVWLFLHLVRCQTAVSQHGEGVVYYGHPITLESIRRETKGIAVRTLKEWVIRLREQGYIRSENHGRKGLVFWIKKGKHKTSKRTIHHVNPPLITKTIRGFGHRSVPIGTGVGHNTVPIAAQAGQECGPIETEVRRQLNDFPTIGSEFSSPITKSLTPKKLSNYNTAAAAQSAASYPSLLGKSEVKTVRQPTPNLTPKPTPKPAPKASDPEFIAWQNLHADRDSTVAAFRKKRGL